MFSLLKRFSLTALIPLFISAQQLSAQPSNQISVEIDPVPYFNNGFALHTKLKLSNSDHFVIGMSIYAMNMPDAFIDANPKNKGNSWNVRLTSGYGFFGEYFFNKVNTKWFIGTLVNQINFQIENEAFNKKKSFATLAFVAYTGYSWSPFDFNMYFKFALGVGYTLKISGQNTIENRTYDINPLIILPAMHIGYTF
jgi:hypothetical protein